MEEPEELSLQEVLMRASELEDVTDLDNYMREQNKQLPEDEQLDEYSIQEVIDSLSDEILQKYGFQALEKKLPTLEPSDDEIENLEVCKELITKFLLDAEPSQVDEAIFKIKHKFNLSTSVSRIVTKFYKDEKRKHETKKNQDMFAGAGDYDMDSTSGRAKIIRDFADIYMRKQEEAGRPLKFINGRLRMFENGIYPESDEIIPFIKKDLVDIGLANGVNMTPTLIDGAIKLIETACPVMADRCEPDKEFVVVLNNGILDTRDWKFSPFDPDKVYFSKIPVNYIADAPKPTHFINLVNSCFKGNEEQIDLLQEAFGYCLTKSYKYQDVFYLIGDGGNGKGTITGILTMLLGSENVTSFSLYQLTDGEHIDYNIAMMHGKHANICGDISARKVVNTENLKKLSSNTDLVTGRHVREKPFQFINYAKMFFLMNRAPESEAHTTGDNRRVRTIRFINSFAEKKGEIKNISQIIRENDELPGILLWSIEGLKRLEANKGFSDKRTVAQRAIEYDKTSNTMRYFVEECLEEDPGNIIPNALMYKAYEDFRKKVGGAQLGEKELKKSLLAECKDAGWNGVTNVQKRTSQLPPDLRDVMENIFGVKSSRCFYGVAIIKDEPQKSLPDYCKEPVVNVYEDDAEAYERMLMDEETYRNGDEANA